MAALYITVAVFVVLIFPIFIKTEVFFDKNVKKAFFAITLYGKIKILGGYAEIIKEGLAFHLSRKKAVILPFASLDMRKQFSLTKDYRIYSFYLLTELGSENSAAIPFTAAMIENVASKISFTVASYNNPRLKLRSDILLHEEESVFKINFGLNVLFNLLTVLITLTKIIIGKISDGK